MFDAPQGRMNEIDEADEVALEDIDEDELVTTPGDDELVDPSVRTGRDEDDEDSPGGRGGSRTERW